MPMKLDFVCYFLILFMSFNVYADTFTLLNKSSKVSVPLDLYYKDDFASQWWYYTGHLESDESKQFGFEVTFFVINVNQKNFKSPFGLQKAYMLHTAITDIDNKKFYYDSRISRGSLVSAGTSKNENIIWLDKNYLKGDILNFHIFTENSNFLIDLNLKALKDAVKNGIYGYSQKLDNCSKCASLYFSIPRLIVEGNLKLNKKTYKVKGLAWFDREINSDYDASVVKGWDWFSIQLDNEVDIMLYLIRDVNNKVQKVSSGTIVYPDGNYKILKSSDFLVLPLKYYKSRKSGAKYPSKWSIKIPSENLNLIVIPLVKDQELVSKISYFPTYWEGACSVEGSSSGKAYVELTGYYKE